MIDPSISLGVKPIQIEDPLSVYGKAQNLLALKQQQQLQQQQMESGALQLQQQRQGMADDQAGRALFAGVQAGGSMPDDASILARLGPTHGAAVVKSLREADKAKADLHKTRGEVAVQEQDYAGGLAAMVKAADYSPEAVQLAISHAHQAGYEQQAQQLQQLLAPENQGKIKPLMDALIQQSPAQQKLITEAATAAAHTKQADTAASVAPSTINRNTAEAVSAEARTPGERAKSDIEMASAAALKTMTRDDWQKGLDATVADKNSPLYQRTQAAVSTALSRGDLKSAQTAIKDAGDQLGKTETAVATARATAPIKIDVATQTAQSRADATGLTDEDYQRSGEQYARTGVMPAMGRDSITRGKIVHAGNAWAKDNGLSPSDVVTMQAAYAGDKDSLRNFQKQRDQIVSFEQTAQKNLDLFINAASKIPDTGVPWLNTPIRKLDASIVGSENMAAVNAARQVANNEIAKVTSGGGLSGVLSDTARHDVASYNPENATFKQTLAVAKILKEDMANRHQAMDATLGDIKSRIGGGPQTPAATPPAGTVHYIDNGVSYDIPGGKEAARFLATHPNAKKGQ
jgi:hypothetical protein